MALPQMRCSHVAPLHAHVCGSVIRCSMNEVLRVTPVSLDLTVASQFLSLLALWLQKL